MLIHRNFLFFRSLSFHQFWKHFQWVKCHQFWWFFLWKFVLVHYNFHFFGEWFFTNFLGVIFNEKNFTNFGDFFLVISIDFIHHLICFFFFVNIFWLTKIFNLFGEKNFHQFFVTFSISGNFIIFCLVSKFSVIKFKN